MGTIFRGIADRWLVLLAICAIVVLSLPWLIRSLNYSIDTPTRRQAHIDGTEIAPKPKQVSINVRDLVGIEPKVAEEMLGSPLESWTAEYSHPSAPFKNIPSESCMYSYKGLEIKLRFIEGGARWITVYFEQNNGKDLPEALSVLGLEYRSPDFHNRLVARWKGLGGSYEVSAFPDGVWSHGVSYILVITAEEYR